MELDEEEMGFKIHKDWLFQKVLFLVVNRYHRYIIYSVSKSKRREGKLEMIVIYWEKDSIKVNYYYIFLEYFFFSP